MRTTLLITTYNWPEALDITLKSIENQSKLPDEIVIADDGSGEKTKLLIEDWQKKSKIPIIHSWQEDIGFRAAMSRNKGIIKSSGEYIIMIDGDLVLHPHFIQNHIDHQLKNQFTIGPRVMLNANYTEKLITNKQITFEVSKNDILANYKNKFNTDLLSKLLSYRTKSHKKVRSCNMACNKEDLIAVNGFNEDFEGWGREDTELVVRLLNANVVRKNILFNVNTLHIFHQENNKNNTSSLLSKNDKILEETITNKLTRCRNGLNKYF